ncbi:uncharacterized protein LOC111388874 [Olea europaea var. sylvestris]|uniref:Uncharacterized protein n=1 Tax=Olea europaea subsp. europaea TaxID=158383 RepID=A0A8S0RQK3_OLEEU|nr:uncharacterized protein LOC111388874 [Olea europaea var. sylvestris]CAA2981494.1 Hypothetical predicted protein [Olea europaea subsp. europaea]
MVRTGEHADESISSGTSEPQGNDKGSVKETEINAPYSGSNGSSCQEQQQKLDINSQMELIGHSIIRFSLSLLSGYLISVFFLIHKINIVYRFAILLIYMTP